MPLEYLPPGLHIASNLGTVTLAYRNASVSQSLVRLRQGRCMKKALRESQATQYRAQICEGCSDTAGTDRLSCRMGDGPCSGWQASWRRRL